MEIRSLVHSAQVFAAQAGRRGIGYVGHLLGGETWPQAAYRFGWGPSARPIVQGLFAAAAELAAGKPDPAELARLKLIAGDPAAIVTSAPADEIERLMNRAHAAGITGLADSFGALVRTADGALAFGNLMKARKHHPSTVYFVASRDADRRAFNRFFGQSLPTEATTRQVLRELEADKPKRKLQRGLRASRRTVAAVAREGIRSPRDLFDQIAALIGGKRVLDLGSNNPSFPLRMLRAGAREVVTVEFTALTADGSRQNARILSWRDVRPYDIHLLSGDMRLFLSEDLGSFDVVTALCPLSFLPEPDMAPIIHKAASMDAVLILQANDAIDQLPAKTLDLHRLMHENGYPEVQVHTVEDRMPLLVGFPWLRAYKRAPEQAGHRLAID